MLKEHQSTRTSRAGKVRVTRRRFVAFRCASTGASPSESLKHLQFVCISKFEILDFNFVISRSSNFNQHSPLHDLVAMSDELEPTAPFTEKLVAYLDGELSEAAARDVEQELASDPAVRAEVEQLNRAWELLDLLPRASASSEFSSRTIATLKTADLTTDFDAVPDGAVTIALNNQQPSASSAKLLTVWGICLLLVAVLSFWGGRQAQQAAPDPLLDDLPLMENLDLYREVGDVEFLRDFQRKGPFDDRRPPEPR